MEGPDINATDVIGFSEGAELDTSFAEVLEETMPADEPIEFTEDDFPEASLQDVSVVSDIGVEDTLPDVTEQSADSENGNLSISVDDVVQREQREKAIQAAASALPASLGIVINQSQAMSTTNTVEQSILAATVGSQSVKVNGTAFSWNSEDTIDVVPNDELPEGWDGESEDVADIPEGGRVEKPNKVPTGAVGDNLIESTDNMDFSATLASKAQSLQRDGLANPTVDQTMSLNSVQQQPIQPIVHHALSQTMMPTQLPAANDSQVALSLNNQVGHTQWADEVSDQVVWLGQQQVKSATIKLNPPELGPLEVSVNIKHDQATVHFSSHHVMVRDALDQALPRLRDMFQDTGVSLLDVSVSDRNTDAQSQRQAWIQADANDSAIGNNSPEAMAAEAMVVPTVKLGLVDYYV